MGSYQGAASNGIHFRWSVVMSFVVLRGQDNISRKFIYMIGFLTAIFMVQVKLSLIHHYLLEVTIIAKFVLLVQLLYQHQRELNFLLKVST
jgi:hypothetical protein